MRIPRLEMEINDALRSQEIIKEQRELVKGHVETIEDIMLRANLTVYTFPLDSGESVKVTLKKKNKKRLDKSGLAVDIDVPKEELSTSGMVKLAEERVLTEKHIIDHTISSTNNEVKIKKKKPRQKKGEEGGG